MENAVRPSRAQSMASGFEGEAFRAPRFARLVEILESLGHVAVAYSGGVDSAFLVKVARSILGDRAIGVLGVSESLDRNELDEAKRPAGATGVHIRGID